MSARFWQELTEQKPTVRRLACSYLDLLLERMHRALACEMRHDVASRFCRWLLELHHWQQGKPVAITHRSLARLLGVRRTTITLLARSLQDAGIISYRRSSIEVVDTYALNQASCQCHQSRHPGLAVSPHQQQLFGGGASWLPIAASS